MTELALRTEPALFFGRKILFYGLYLIFIMCRISYTIYNSENLTIKEEENYEE